MRGWMAARASGVNAAAPGPGPANWVSSSWSSARACSGESSAAAISPCFNACSALVIVSPVVLSVYTNRTGSVFQSSIGDMPDRRAIVS